MQSLSNYSPPSTELSLDRDSISIYTDAVATGKDIVNAAGMIKKAFPALTAGFYDSFDDRVQAHKFTAQRLKDAVAFVIDNCPYPTPTLANFISYDKTVPHRNYEQMCKEALTYDGVWREWLAIKYPELPKVVWVHANDVVKYKLETYLVK